MKTPSPGPQSFSFLSIFASFGLILPALAVSSPRSNAQHDTLTWGSCIAYPTPYECSTFRVPLDYARPSVGSTTLSIVRLPASTSPREGYMFYNPGGPGASGVEFVGQHGTELQAQLGAGWDVLGWDPRGIGGSGPNITLFETAAEIDTFLQQLQGTEKFDAHGNLTQSSDVAFFRSKAPEFDEFLQDFDTKYKEKSGDNLKYVGTCAIVRDLVGMTDAIYGPGSDVNFYGYSYGTLIAAYLTQMFPHRVGKVIADGVLDAYSWTRTPTVSGLATDIVDAEAALRGWSSACASSANCTLATLGNSTTEGVLRVIDNVLDTVYKTYDGTKWSLMDFTVNGTLPADIHALPFDAAASFLYSFLFNSGTWTTLDQSISGLYAIQNNLTTSLNTRSFPTASRAPILKLRSSGWGFANGAWDQREFVVTCGDSLRTPSNYTTSTVFEELIRISQTVSPHFGSVLSSRTFCHRWTTRAVERLGDIHSTPEGLNTKPKNVVLVIGNEADPITPYVSAQKLASKKRLGNKARLVKYNAIGHTSVSNPSSCINEVISSYVKGTVPVDKGDDGPDVVCEVDSTPFSA
ncbi:hypothetical protein M408DRAFT_284190 [Serendipita vermifera MAFF 305830]|uniref:Uncharacterized protein n=1 Tax=Serendipita vermifera MAFF 305830 TaxID=933852 RepID=A0A0C3AT27_SERVB|nr:hypothetical protein M408DRAFT_284190 [Serendipita vermifera MAFF 305830]